MAEYVIIGNGVAAVGCIEGIRSVDKESKITVVSKEDHFVYGRPLISYYLEDKTDLSRMRYRPEGFYKNNNCSVLYSKTATAVDTKNHTITLDDGTALPFTSVCVATGSSPFIPPLEGLDSVDNKFSFITLDDALKLKKTVTKNSKVLIVGAGLIGLKCAEGLRAITEHITVCDLADRVLSSILDYDSAAVVKERLEQNGISFMLSDSITKFSQNKAEMKSGKTVDFDILVLAVGVRANTQLIKNAGGETNRGIIINNKSETSINGIYAAGDCSECEDISSGTKKVLALLPNAYMQGHTAGINMAGGSAEFKDAIPMNSIGFFGLHIMTAGSYDGKCIEEKTKTTLKRFYIKDNLLIGFMLIGETERAGIYTSLIREKTPLSTIDFDLLVKNSTSFVFSSEIRRKKFSGVV